MVTKCSSAFWLNAYCKRLTFAVLPAMAELVPVTGLTVAAERPETIFIGTRSQFAKGAGHVWRYQLTDVGARRIYLCLQPPKTTYENDVMFIVPELEGETVFYVAYEGRVVNAELEQRAAVFRTSASFWEVGDHVWETNSPPAVQAMSRNGRSRSGRLRAGPFAHSMGSNGFWAGRAEVAGSIVGLNCL